MNSSGTTTSVASAMAASAPGVGRTSNRSRLRWKPTLTCNTPPLRGDRAGSRVRQRHPLGLGAPASGAAVCRRGLCRGGARRRAGGGVHVMRTRLQPTPRSDHAVYIEHLVVGDARRQACDLHHGIKSQPSGRLPARLRTASSLCSPWMRTVVTGRSMGRPG